MRNRLKHMGRAAGLILGISLLSLLYLNVAPSDPCTGSALCRAMFDAYKSEGDLTSEQAMDHVIHRLGYGVSSADRSLTSVAASDVQLKHLLRRVAGAIENPSRPFMSEEMARLGNSYVFTTPNFGYTFNAVKMNTAALQAIYSRIYERLTANKSNWPEVSADLNYMRSKVKQSSAQFRLLMNALGSQRVVSGRLVDDQVNFNALLQDFWFNHFNVDYTKINLNSALGSGDYQGQQRYSYEETIHRKMYGTFADLLESVQTHTAMLIYLDNQTNRFTFSLQAASNQNLGRELLELHTLGRGPGSLYNQNDIEGSALMLTGLNILNRRADGVRYYETVRNYSLHVPDYISIAGARVQKAPVVIGKRFCLNQGTVIPKNQNCPDITFTGTPEEKEAKLKHIQSLYYKHLASLDQTKHFICKKIVGRVIASRYVSNGLPDNPVTLSNESITEVQRASVVGRCKEVWGTYGNLGDIYRVILTSPEMWNRNNYQRMVKNPMELAISSVRSSGLVTTDFAGEFESEVVGAGAYINGQVTFVGLPYRNWMAPTGYKEYGWTNQGYFVRWVKANFNLINLMESRLSRFTPVMDIQNNGADGLTGSAEEIITAISSGSGRYSAVRSLLGNTSSVRANSQKIQSDIISAITSSPGAINSKMTREKIDAHSPAVPVPLKTGVILETSSLAFIRR